MTQSKIAIITGGSRGLGKNMAVSLAQKGINVVLTYNSKKEEAEAVVKFFNLISRILFNR